MSGAFITFEGGEGSGKSTQLKLLGDAFANAKLPYLLTREPGGTSMAEYIRGLLVEGTHAIDPETETLLFYAARADHVNAKIKPALAEGKTVLCDRFADSTMVYQSMGKGLDEDFIRSLHQLVLQDFAPKLTIILDIDPKQGLERAHTRRGAETRFESLGLSFHEKVRQGFLSIAQREPKRCAVLDAAQDIATLNRQIIETVKSRLGIGL